MSRSITFLLASSLFLAALALQPVQAGSQASPEITDAEHDLSLLGTVPGCVANPGVPAPAPSTICVGDVADAAFEAGLGGDILHAWIDHENATTIQVNVETHGDPEAFMQDEGGDAGSVIGSIRLTASMTVNGTSKDAIAQFSKADGVPTVGGVATSVSFNSTGGFVTSLTVPRSVFGNITVGMQLTGFKVVGESRGLGPDAPEQGQGAAPASIFKDTAPDTGAGTPYNFTIASHTGGSGSGGSGGGGGNLNGAPGCTYKSGETNRSDADADCLPDHWETQYFGNTGAQNGTGDPDGDGCNNRCEYLHGTDPTKKDTDGDGTNDNDEIKAGTDPTNPSSFPGSGGGTSTSTSTTTSTTTTTGTTTPTSSSSSTTSSSTSQTPLELIQADAGYAVASAAAMGAVVLVSLIGLFGRWGA